MDGEGQEEELTIFIFYLDHNLTLILIIWCFLYLLPVTVHVYDFAQTALIMTESHLFKPPNTPDSAHQLITGIWVLEQRNATQKKKKGGSAVRIQDHGPHLQHALSVIIIFCLHEEFVDRATV